MYIVLISLSPEAEFMNVQFRWGFCALSWEFSQTWGFCMDFLNHRKGVKVFYQVFLLSPLKCTVTELETVRGCMSLKKYKSLSKAVDVTVNSKEENSSDFCLDCPRIRPLGCIFILGKSYACLCTYICMCWGGNMIDVNLEYMHRCESVPSRFLSICAYSYWWRDISWVMLMQNI
jgi:hypothetical protein